MNIKFKKAGERAKFIYDIAGLSEIMAAFIKSSKEQKDELISKADSIDKFSAICHKTAFIDYRPNNQYGSKCAKELLKKSGFPFEVDIFELETLWKEITKSWEGKTNGFFLSLKQALYTKLPVSPPDDLKAMCDQKAEEKTKEFWAEFQRRDAELEKRISDPDYWQKIASDLMKFQR
jgi:hypothetical protein